METLMETMAILVKGILKASDADCVTRLDIQYNSISDMYIGYCYLSNGCEYVIREDGVITKI